jgi:DNA repair exonuclease SbcCD ATPase subunit
MDINPYTNTDDYKELLKELQALQVELIEKETDLISLKSELRAFEYRYLCEIGPLIAKLDELNAKIAELESQQSPTKEKTEYAERLRQTAEESAKASHEAAEIPEKEKKSADETIKKLFWEAAKLVHPDFATNDADRERRTRLMQDLNIAFDEQDEEKIRSIIDSINQRKEGQTLAPESMEIKQLKQRIESIKHRLGEIEQEMAMIRYMPIHNLMMAVEQGEKESKDLFKEMSDKLNRDIDQAKIKLTSLQQ